MKPIQVLVLASFTCILTTMTTRATPAPVPAGLVGWWQGDGNTLDTIATNNGVNQNVGYTAGVVGQAFAFDPENFPYGTYSGIQIADQPAYVLTNSLTIEAWIRPRGDSYNIFFRGDHRPGLDPYFFGMSAGSNINLWITDESGNNAMVGTPIPYFAWTHVAATLDGSSGVMQIYTNGMPAAQTITSIRPFGQLKPDQSPGIGIGNVNDGGNNFPFIGDVDELSLYNRALTAGEIQGIFNAGSAGKVALSGGPLLLNLDIMGTNLVASAKKGFAAVGLTTNDFWNYYTRDDGFGGWRTYWAITNMVLADGTVTSIGAIIPNMPGAWPSGSSDPMYAEYCYPFSGDATITVTNLPAGTYDVLPYSPDSSFEVVVGGVSQQGIRRTYDNPVSNPPIWTEGIQYARFTNILVGADQSLILVAHPGLGSYAVIAGLQILSSGTTTNLPLGVPVISSFTPTAGTNGTVVTIFGTNFNAGPAANIVYFGAVRAPVSSSGQGSLTVTVPSGATYGPVTVTTGGRVAYSGQLFEPTFTGGGSNVTSSSFAPSFDLATGSGPGSSLIADFDGDGKPDIALVSGDAHVVSIFRNLGTNSTLLGEGSFAPRVDLPFPTTGTAGNPYRLRAADLDGDGRLDLIACEYLGARVTVFHNVAAPGILTTNSFEPAFALDAGSDCRSAAAADLDHDGRVDIVALNYGSKSISIFKNIGSSGTLTTNSFAPAVVLAAPGGPYEATIADLNHDGQPDLAVANTDSGTVSIYQNQSAAGVLATNSFAPRFDMACGSGASTIIAADVDGDGNLDLVAGSVFAQTLNVFQSVQAGGLLTANSFRTRVDFSTPGWMHTVSMADFNGDARPDIGVVGELNSYMAIFQNNTPTAGVFTTESLAPRVDFGTGWNAWGVAAGDLDGDGRPDVVFCNAYDSNIQIYQNVMPFGGGSPPVITNPPTITAFSPRTGVMGTTITISGTNFSPIVSANLVYFGAVQALVSAASPTSLTVTVPAGATYAPITVAVNGFVAYGDSPFLPTFTGNGDAIDSSTFAAGFNLPAASGPYRVVLADLDGDGRPDLVVNDGYAGTFSIYQNMGTNNALNSSSFAAPISFFVASNSAPRGLVAADLNADGKLDILLSDSSNNRVVLFQNLSSGGTLTTNSFAAPVSFAVGADPRTVVVSDLDGDGHPDIINMNAGSGTISILRSTGTTGPLTTNSFGARVDLPMAGNGEGLAVGDLDGDGKPDLALADSSGFISIYRNNCTPGNLGVNTFADRLDLPGQTYSIAVAIGDLDGDGKAELVTCSYLPQTMSVYRNQASPGTLTTNSFTAPVNYALAGRGHTLALADFNGDGRLDISVVTELADSLAVFQNIGTGSFNSSSLAARVDFPAGYNAWGVAAGDLNGDGRPDIAFGNSYDNTLTIYKNQSAFGSTGSCTPVPSGIVGWWPGEGNANDLIGNNNAALIGGATYASGEVGQGFRLDGTNAYVEIPDANSLKPTNVTVEAWVRLDPTVPPHGGGEQIIFKRNSWSFLFEGYSLLKVTIDNGNGTYTDRFQFCVTSSGNQVALNSITVAQRGVWYHVAGTYDGSKSTLYVNGVAEALATPGFALDYGTRPVFIGTSGEPAPYTSMFAGVIDEPSIYSRALATNEIAAIYNAGSAGKCQQFLAPVIITQPTNQSVLAGTMVSFSAVANGAQPLNYQWSFNGTNILGATGPTLTLTNVQAGQAGSYVLLVTNSFGSTVSSNAFLTVTMPPTPPTILAQTPSQVVLLGSPATFSVAASGSDPLSFFWQRDGALISNATNSSYTLNSAQLSDSGSKFSCLVTNAYGLTLSTNATLKVIDGVFNDLCSGAVVITNASYTNTQSTLKATSFGDPVPGCIDGFGNGVWYQFTAPVGGLLTVDTFGSDFDTGLAIYSGACGALTEAACNDDTGGVTSLISMPTTTGTTYYILIGGYSAHSGNLALHFSHLTPPVFMLQPTNQSVVVSSNASFPTLVTGAQPISFQWYFNDTLLMNGGRFSGCTNATLSIESVVSADAGSYQVVASNFLGVTTSSVAVLTPVILPPVFVQVPASQAVGVGSNANFNAMVSGTPPFSYQWDRDGYILVDDGVHIFGSTSSSLNISNLDTADSGNYTLTVTNQSGSASVTAVLVVMTPPVFTSQPVGRSVPPGLPTTFNASASGVPAPYYHWQFNGTNVSDWSPASSFNLAAVTTNNLGAYQIVAQNSMGTSTSTVAQLTFGPVAAWGRNLSGECLPPPGLSNVVSVAGGIVTSFAVRADGSVAFWGSGSGTNVPASATNVVAVAATGLFGNYALKADGKVVGWAGSPPSGLSNIVSVAAGFNFGMALRAEGNVVGWGNPLFATVPAGLNHIAAIACGFTHSLALRNDGTVVAWGTGSVTNVPARATNVTAIAAGYAHSLALKSDGTVVAWGSGSGTNLPAGLTNITVISTENTLPTSFSLALRADGTIVTWGESPYGETTPPPALNRLLSIAIAAAPNHGLVLVSDGSPQILLPPVGLTAYTGRDVTLQASAVGAAPLNYQWRLNGTNIPNATNTSLLLANIQMADAGNYQFFVSNSLSTALSLPAPVNVISNTTLVLLSQTAAVPTNLYQGGKFTVGGVTVLGSGPLRYQWFFSPTNKNYLAIARATNDTLVGEPALAVQSGNYYLAVSNQLLGLTSAPVSVRVQFARAWGFQSVSNPPVNVTNAIAVATGGTAGSSTGHYLALGADGKLTAWGVNTTPSVVGISETNVATLSNSFVTAIAAGPKHSLALKSDGTVYAWGSGATNPPTGLNGVIAIACGDYHDLALKSDGTVAGWISSGQPNYGQATNNFAATNVVAIAAGARHSLALRADGSVVGWGYASDGATFAPFPATNVIAIVAGSGFSAALRANGTVVQWGSGIANYPVPLNLSNIVAISAASTHCTALRNDGSVVSWGFEYVGLASNNVPADLANVSAITSGGDHDFALFGTRAPAFTIQPWNRAIPLGARTNITLAAKCAGVQPMSYQWQLNGTNIPGANKDVLILTNQPSPQFGPVRFIPIGSYQLVASNAYGVVASKPAKVSLVVPLADALDTVDGKGLSLYNWITTGNGQWFGETNVTHDGVDAARSGGIGSLQESVLQTTVATNWSGRYTFWWKVSSEQFFDTLEFRVNGITQASISGEADWQQVSLPVAAGTNILQWRYAKDVSFDVGQDAGWVDQFAFVPDSPTITLQPLSQTVNMGANVTFRVTATGLPRAQFIGQWRQNGNLIGTGLTLTLANVARAQNGTYSVTVTDAINGGSTVSSNAVLKVLVPQLLGVTQLLPDATFRLTSTDPNGGLLSPSDLANFEAQASTNLVDWVTLPSALSLTNGALLLQDSGPTNYPARYYRIIEH